MVPRVIIPHPGQDLQYPSAFSQAHFRLDQEGGIDLSRYDTVQIPIRAAQGDQFNLLVGINRLLFEDVVDKVVITAAKGQDADLFPLEVGYPLDCRSAHQIVIELLDDGASDDFCRQPPCKGF